MVGLNSRFIRLTGKRRNKIFIKIATN